MGGLSNIDVERLKLIARADPSFVVMHIRERTAFDAELIQQMFDLAKLKAREKLDEIGANYSSGA